MTPAFPNNTYIIAYISKISQCIHFLQSIADMHEVTGNVYYPTQVDRRDTSSCFKGGPILFVPDCFCRPITVRQDRFCCQNRSGRTDFVRGPVTGPNIAKKSTQFTSSKCLKLTIILQGAFLNSLLLLHVKNRLYKNTFPSACEFVQLHDLFLKCLK